MPPCARGAPWQPRRRALQAVAPCRRHTSDHPWTLTPVSCYTPQSSAPHAIQAPVSCAQHYGLICVANPDLRLRLAVTHTARRQQARRNNEPLAGRGAIHTCTGLQATCAAPLYGRVTCSICWMAHSHSSWMLGASLLKATTFIHSFRAEVCSAVPTS